MRRRQRLRLLGMPDAEIARVEREGKPSARVTVTAPQAGIVWEIGARDGMAVMPGVTLFRLAGIGTVWVTAEVPEAQAALVRVGAPVEARAAAYPDRVFKGSVNALLPEVNAQTRTVRARIVLANPGGVLKPGMFATVSFGAPAGGAVGARAGRSGDRDRQAQRGHRRAGEGRFMPVDVDVGRQSGDLVEIRKGIAVGQRVVVSGQFLIDSEASLKGALTRIAASGQEGSLDDRAGGGSACRTRDACRTGRRSRRAQGRGRRALGRRRARHQARPDSVARDGRDDDGVQGARRAASRRT